MSSNNSLLVRNTLMLYVRTFVVLIVSLFTVRIIFSNLGASDYGIQNVVSGFVSMFTFVTGSLSVTFSRFYAIEIGRGNIDKLKDLFSNSVIIMTVLSVVLFLIIEVIGVPFLNYKMNIPDGRMYAANWVFQLSILTLCVQLFTIIYDALIISYERMSVYAYISIFDVILKLLIAYLIQISPSDKLVTYAFLLLIQNFVVFWIYRIYCNRRVLHLKVTWSVDKGVVRELLALTGWDLFGSSSFILKNYGSNLILNIFFGTIVNASRGIAMQINVAITKFSGGFLTALRPQILKSYALKDYDRLFLLVDNGTRFSSYLLLILSIPIMIESHYIINLWLGNVPDHCASFVVLILILSLSEGTLIYAHNTTLLALGKIKKCQIITGTIQLLNLPISYILLYFYPYPELTLIVAIVIAHICCFIRVKILSDYIAYSIKKFFLKTYLMIILVSVLSVIPPLLLHHFMEETFIRFVLVSMLSLLSSSFFVLYMGCSQAERIYIYEKIKNNILKH